ncbi:MAG: hypothetical protein AAFN93_25180, partial [Bacteroidota bacterium]
MRFIFQVTVIALILSCSQSNTRHEDHPLYPQVSEMLGLIGKDYDKALELAEVVRNASLEANYNYGVVKSILTEAYIYYKRVDYEKAIIYYHQALDIARNKDYSSFEADLLSSYKNAGAIFLGFDQYDLSNAYNDKSLDLVLNSKDYQEYGSLAYNKSRILARKNDFEESIGILKDAMTYAQHFDPITLANYYNKLVNLYSDVRDVEKSL